MKDKKVLIAIIAVVILLLAGGAYFFISRNAHSDQDDQFGQAVEDLPKLRPEDIGLSLELRSDKRGFRFTVGKTQDIKEVQFDAVYAHRDNPAEDIYDDLKIKEKGTPFVSKFYDLATCSSGTCRFHVGVKEVKFTFTITKDDGKQYLVNDSLKVQ